jgi:tRNA-uridine 2-sulfurtransferase
VNNSNKGKKVAVGLSGGVDSSVAAHLLKKQGYEVVGVYIQCWEEGFGCRSDEDRAYAVQTAAKLGIKIEQLDFIKEYKEKVVSYFYSEYKAGRTPNPDVLCNKEIKFGMFFEWAMKEGFDYVATGHYARVDRVKLLRGVDDGKDQSYFLYLLTPEVLEKTLFPIGGMKKEEIRKIARKLNLPAKDRPDSTGICFIGEVDIKGFLGEKIKPKKGKVLDSDGEVIGEHEGAWFYTIGQRRGFTVKKYQGKPLFVVSKDVSENILVVGDREDALAAEFDVGNMHWIGGARERSGPGGVEFKCLVRIRHLGELHEAVVTDSGEGELHVSLEKPVFGVAPGQSAVFYKGEEVLGGGIIQ